MTRSFLFTSESVSEGHPDKMADQISDSILDAVIMQDPSSRVACETLVNTGLALVSGEITTTAQVDYADIVRDTIRDIGYTSSAMGYDYKGCSVMVALDKQSPNIAQGVNEGEGLDLEQGAGDQGLMFGFACSETDVLMPFAITYAHRLVERQAEVRRSGRLPWLRPDAKSQVTVLYEDGAPVSVDTVVLSTQHAEDIEHGTLSEAVIEEIIKPVLPQNMVTEKTRYLVNPTGSFVIGGPHGDCGLTGRKIVVDTYGGAAHHGGGAFSGKDPSKVARSAAYAIGDAQPVSLMVNTQGTAVIPEEEIEKLVHAHFDLRPKGIIRELDLLRPIYRKSAAYGHFGREEPDFHWEKTDKAEIMRSAAGL